MKGQLIGILGFIAAVTLGFALASMYVKPNDKDILSLFGLIFPYAYIFGLLIIPLTYRHQKITFFIGLTLLLFGAKSFFAYVKPASFSKDETGKFHVMSFNAMRGKKMLDKHHKFTKEQQRKFNYLIRQEPLPDIICAQEVKPFVQQAFTSSFGFKHIHQINKKGATIISKYPFVNVGQVDFGSHVNSCLWADIAINESDTLRIYSVHLESNRIRESSYEFLQKDYETREAINGIKDLIIKYPLYAGERGEQANRVKQHINSSPYSVIVCGDLNDPPVSYTYRTIKKGLNDTFLNKGTGFGTTWIGPIPMLRIDYIFASKNLKNTGFSALNIDLSDHYPIIASFNLDK